MIRKAFNEKGEWFRRGGVKKGYLMPRPANLGNVGLPQGWQLSQSCIFHSTLNFLHVKIYTYQSGIQHARLCHHQSHPTVAPEPPIQ